MTPEEKREMIRQLLMTGGPEAAGQWAGAQVTQESHPGRLYMKPDMKGGGEYVTTPPEVWSDGLLPPSAYPNSFPRTMYYNPEQHQYTHIPSGMGGQDGLPQVMPGAGPVDEEDMLAPLTSPRPQPAPSPLRRRSMMDRAQGAQEDAYARQIDPEQWALYQIEDEGVAFKEMLRDLPPELYREVLRKVAEGVPVPEAFAPAGFTTRR